MNIFRVFLAVFMICYSLFMGTFPSYAADGVLGDSKIFAKGERWEFLNKEGKVIIDKKVSVKSPDFDLWSDKLIVFYEKSSKSSTPETTPQKVKEAYAIGNVVIEMKNGYTTFSDEAHYDKGLNKMILQGNASIRSDKDHVKGCVITYNIASASYSVESCPDQPAGGAVKIK